MITSGLWWWRMSSKRSAALVDLRSRLAWIAKDNDYSSDIGNQITMGEVYQLGPDDSKTGIAVMVGDDSGESAGQRTTSVVPVEVVGYIPYDTVDAVLVIEGIIEDIKRAVEIEEDGARDRFLGTTVDDVPYGTLPCGVERGAVRTIPREAGSPIIGASVTYMLTFQEDWGQP